MSKLETKIVKVSDEEEALVTINREKKLFNVLSFVNMKNGGLPITESGKICKVMEDKGFKHALKEEVEEGMSSNDKFESILDFFEEK